MTKEAAKKKRIEVRANGPEDYHEREDYGINYAFQGYTKNLYFTSDRAKALDAEFRLADGSPLKGYGLEMEEECYGIDSSRALVYTMQNLAFSRLPRNLFKYQHDGSLDGDSSAEAITQVMTKEFIRNNYQNFRFAYDVFDVYDITASRSGNCGMHCNMSVGLFGTTKSTREEAIRKFVYFVNKNYDLACVLVKRPLCSTRYCGKMYEWDEIGRAKAFDFDSTNERASDHSVCFNLAHYKTGRVELRLVGGQPSYHAFRNTMETIFHLVDAVKRVPWSKMDDMAEVFKGCNQFVVKRLDDAVSARLISQADYRKITASSVNVDFGEAGK